MEIGGVGGRIVDQEGGHLERTVHLSSGQFSPENFFFRVEEEEIGLRLNAFLKVSLSAAATVRPFQLKIPFDLHAN